MPWSLFFNKWVLGAIAVAGLGVSLWIQTARLDAEKKRSEGLEMVAAQWRENFRTVEQTARDNAVAVAKLQAEKKRIDGIVAEANAKYSRLGKAYEKLKGQAYADQNPVTADWCNLLDGLRIQQGGTGPACAGQNGSGAP